MFDRVFAAILENQARIRNLKLSFQIVEEREATASNPALYVVEARILLHLCILCILWR
jgi:hypothetical protein